MKYVALDLKVTSHVTHMQSEGQTDCAVLSKNESERQ